MADAWTPCLRCRILLTEIDGRGSAPQASASFEGQHPPLRRAQTVLVQRLHGQELDTGFLAQRRQQLVLLALGTALDLVPHRLQHQLDLIEIAFHPDEPPVELRHHAPVIRQCLAVLRLHLADAGDGLTQAVELGLDPFPGSPHPLAPVVGHLLLRSRSPRDYPYHPAHASAAAADQALAE